jgi:hypothetical protein
MEDPMDRRIVGVALYLAWLTACSGQSGTEKDGGDDDCPDFAIVPLITAMSGAFAGDGLSLEVVAGEPAVDCDASAYVVPLTLTLRQPDLGIDERLSSEAAIGAPDEVVVAKTTSVDVATSTWRDPAMDGATDLHYAWDLTFHEASWTVEVGWSGTSGSGEAVGGRLGTWRVE